MVVVTKPTLCCGGNGGIGVVGTVQRRGIGGFYCDISRRRYVCDVAVLDDGNGYEVSRLKKLDAPLEDETVDEAIEVKA